MLSATGDNLETNYPIPTSEARSQGLQGSDSFTHSAIIYLDDFHRRLSAFRLVQEAVNAFGDSLAFSRSRDLNEQVEFFREYMKAGGLLSDLEYRHNQSWDKYIRFRHLEYLKLAAGFELALKAMLLRQGYLVHIIDKKSAVHKHLASAQKTGPISVEALLEIAPYQFDGSRNFLPGILPQSIKFSWLTLRREYRATFPFSETEMDIVDDYRKLRNMIHLPGDWPDLSDNIESRQATSEKVVKMVNDQVIDWANSLLNGTHFERLRIPLF